MSLLEGAGTGEEWELVALLFRHLKVCPPLQKIAKFIIIKERS